MNRSLSKKGPVTQQSLSGPELKSTDRSLPEKCPATQPTYKSLFKQKPLTQQELWASKPQSKVTMTLPKKSPVTHQLLKPKSRDRTLFKKTPATQQQVQKRIEPKSTDVLTHQQMRVANHSIRDGEVLKVVALAGKTVVTLLYMNALSAAKTCSEV